MKTMSQLLKNKKLKVTPQRLAIYNMLYNTDQHPTAEIIYKTLEEQYPTMSLATVYKTLDALESAGLVQELNVGQGGSRYDACVDMHFHLVCDRCNNVIDLKDAPLVEEIRREVAKRIDFKVRSGQICFFGVCGDCTEKAL